MKKSRVLLIIASIIAILALAIHPVYADDPEDVSGRTSVAKMSFEELRSLYGSVPSASSLYLIEPVVSGSDYSPSVLTDAAYAEAAAYINYYRAVAGLTPVSFTSELNNSSSYGALVLAMGNQFSHYPTQPADMSSEDFDIAYYATEHSNLSYSSSTGTTSSASYVLRTAISGQMADSSDSNIGTVGHRRWLLNPVTQTMGIGTADCMDGSWHNFYTSI